MASPLMASRNSRQLMQGLVHAARLNMTDFMCRVEAIGAESVLVLTKTDLLLSAWHHIASVDLTPPTPVCLCRRHDRARWQDVGQCDARQCTGQGWCAWRQAGPQRRPA
eukprot:355943-Chlamydomonas_euryale.AAC.12